MTEFIPVNRHFFLYANIEKFGSEFCTALMPLCNDCKLSEICDYFNNKKYLERMKNILIISCGPGIDEIRKDFGHAIDWIQNGIDKKSYNFTSVDAYLNQVPFDPNIDGWILTGSSSSVYEDKAWIIELENSIRKAIELEIPILGMFWSSVNCSSNGRCC